MFISVDTKKMKFIMFIIEEKIMWNKAEFYIHVFNNVTYQVYSLDSFQNMFDLFVLI